MRPAEFILRDFKNLQSDYDKSPPTVDSDEALIKQLLSRVRGLHKEIKEFLKEQGNNDLLEADEQLKKYIQELYPIFDPSIIIIEPETLSTGEISIFLKGDESIRKSE